MTIYCGVDFHARQQTICFCNSAGEESRLAELRHDRDDVRGFYSQFTGEVVVGIEASGYSSWFVELLEGLGHRVLIGDAAEIRRRARRRQKNEPTPHARRVSTELSGRAGVKSSIIIAATSYTSYRFFNPLESRQSVGRPWQIITQRSGHPATCSRECQEHSRDTST